MPGCYRAAPMRRWLDYPETRHGADHSVVGDLRVLPGVECAELGNTRDLLVLLPPSYHTSYRRYPVLYMHDGQNLFDRVTSYAGEWQVDETMERLCDEGIEAIVVGIPNAGERRLDEYSPFRDDRFGGGAADAYLRFVVQTVKPLVDGEFRTAAEREATGTLGSSLGGLISLYAFFQYPGVFGLAGAMSPSVGFARAALLGYLGEKDWVPGRIYLDCGGREGAPRIRDPLSLRPESGGYVAAVRRAHEMLLEKGYRDGTDARLVVEPRGLHNEEAWARRLPDALRFLLGVKS